MKCLINSPAGFDIFELAGLAADQGFDGIQLYLNRELAGDLDRLDQWCARLQEKGLFLVIHLPPECGPAVLCALERIVRDDTVVISHYPDQPLQCAGGMSAWEFSSFGILPVEYDAWLDDCRLDGAVPVFDLPRLFKDSDEQDAGRFADRLFTRLAGVRYVLHLIDCDTAEQQRGQWCELGEGRVGRYLQRAVIPLPEMAVLEYESLIQSVNSLSFLRRLDRDLGH